jgi:hypothetical protein
VHSFCRAHETDRATHLVIGECQRKLPYCLLQDQWKNDIHRLFGQHAKCHFGQKVKYEVINTRHNHEHLLFLGVYRFVPERYAEPYGNGRLRA